MTTKELETRLVMMERRWARLEQGVARSMEQFTQSSFEKGFDVTQTDLYKLMIQVREAAAGDVSVVKPPAPGEGRA